MKSKRSFRLFRLLLLLLSLLLLTAVYVVCQESGDDPILDYYWDKACNVMLQVDSVKAKSTYVFRARSFRHRVDSEGHITKTDSLEADHFYSGSTLDSQTVVSGDPERFEDLDLAPFNIYKHAYHLNMFPNDTGGVDLAIGLTSDSTTPTQPDGLLIMDRREFYVKWLYLPYSDKPGYKRYTKSFRFIPVDGLIFPDSIWEVGTKQGVFSSENYRLETGISDIKVLH